MIAGGLNHFGFVVDDIKGISKRLLENGYKRSYSLQIEKYRIRDYFFDNEGNEYEFVQYLVDDMEKRNSYSE